MASRQAFLPAWKAAGGKSGFGRNCAVIRSETLADAALEPGRSSPGQRDAVLGSLVGTGRSEVLN